MATVSPPATRSRRGAELALLAAAVALSTAVHVIAGYNLTGAPLASTVNFAASLGGIALGLHLIVRWRAPYADPVILPLVMTLNGIGIAFLYRLDITYERTGAAGGFGPRQLLWTLVGAALAAATLFVIRDHRLLRRLPFISMIAALLLLMTPLIPGLGMTVNGATIWIQIAGYTFQPAEVAKILLAIFFAGYLVNHRDSLTLAGPKIGPLQLPRWVDFGPILVVWAASVGILVLQRDLGTSLLFFGMFVAMLYVATERLSWIIIGLLLFLAGVFLVVNMFDHVAARFDIWLDPFNAEIYGRSAGGSYQIVQGLFALASGGLFGTGIGLGYPTLVPVAYADYIYTTIGEELGLVGSFAILMLYMLLLQRGLRTAIGVRDGFGKLLSAGLTFAIAFQIFVVIGGITLIIPLTGLTMPFLAAGGSSLVANWIIMALLLRLSDSARRPAPDPLQPLGEHTMKIALEHLGSSVVSVSSEPERSSASTSAHTPAEPFPAVSSEAKERSAVDGARSPDAVTPSSPETPTPNNQSPGNHSSDNQGGDAR